MNQEDHMSILEQGFHFMSAFSDVYMLILSFTYHNCDVQILTSPKFSLTETYSVLLQFNLPFCNFTLLFVLWPCYLCVSCMQKLILGSLVVVVRMDVP